MSEFINTIDALGDDVVMDSLIQRTITEFRDNRVETVGVSAFSDCKALTIVDLPRLKTLAAEPFQNCSALVALILRNRETVASLLRSNYIPSQTFVYVPQSMVDTYKTATNWVSIQSNLRPLEQYTVDGTVMGELTTVFYVLNTSLTRVSLSNHVTEVGPRYYATLTSTNTNPIEEVVITMSGVDITADVYNAETGEISIPVVTGALKITASAAAPSIVSGYVTEELYVHLDACDVSSGSTVWFDRVNGIEFALSGFSESSFTGRSVKFAGTTSAFSATSMSATNGVTIEFRLANLNVTKSCNRIFHSLSGFGTHAGRPFVMHSNGWGSQRGITACTYGGTNLGTGSILNANEEYTVAVTVEPNGIKTVYIDGERVVSGTNLAPVDFECMAIGYLDVFGTGEAFEGELKSMRLYTRALSADEVYSNFCADEILFE